MKTIALLLVLVLAPTRALPPNATCVCVARLHTCLISGLVETVCWGNGTNGRLGYASRTNYFSPSAALAANPGGVQVTQTGVVAVLKLACGGAFTMALLTDGTVQGWGWNAFGQLGRAHTQPVGDNEHPYEPPEGGPVTLSGPACDIACGVVHCCAVMASPNLGKVACWGVGLEGRLGYANQNNIGDNEVVASAGFVDVGGTDNVTAVFCGGYHALALMSNGALRSWGLNVAGQLGLGHTSDIGDNEHPSSQPDIALALGGNAIDWVSGGGWQSCVTSVGRGKCWGVGWNGRLGTGNTNDVTDPSAIGFLDFGPGESVMQLETFREHTCGLLRSGFVKCFGNSTNAQLGCGWHCPDRLAPSEPVALNGNVSGLSVGSRSLHTVAIHPGRQFQAWGWGNSGQVGYGDTANVGDDETPASVGNVNFTDGVICAAPPPNFTFPALSVTATAGSKTVTATATQPSETHASHTQTGITRTPRSRPATRGSSSATRATTTAERQQPLPSLALSPSPSAGSSSVLIFVLVGVCALALLVLVCFVGLPSFLVVRLRRMRGRDDEGSVVMEAVPSVEAPSRTPDDQPTQYSPMPSALGHYPELAEMEKGHSPYTVMPPL